MLEWALRSFRNGYAVRPEFAAYGYFFDFQMDVMRKINNTNAHLYEIPGFILDEIIS